MKTITFILTVLFGAELNISQAQDSWTQKNDLGYNAPNAPVPSSRSGAVGFSIGSKGYVGMGQGDNNYYKDFWEYDPDLNTWTQKADFGGTARYRAVGFTIGSKGYIGTGDEGNYNYTNDFWEYDPDLNTWTQKADFEGTARYSAVGFSIGSKGYMGTGYSDGFPYYKDFWEYDPDSNSWTQKADFVELRAGAVGFSIGSKGYVGTGYNGSNHTKDFWEYDPNLNSWTQKSDFGGTARWDAVGFSIGSKGYLGTGADPGSKYKDFWEYDPDLNSWTQKVNFGGIKTGGAVGFSIGSKGYLGTGYSGCCSKEDFWEYNPDLNSWTQKADFGGTARNGAVGFNIGSKGYVGTGYKYDNDDYQYKDFWEYNPGLNGWTKKADFGETARNGAVGFSIGNKGYMGTGADDAHTYKNDFWEYDPDLNTWTQKADFGGTARHRAVGFSIGSKGYVGMGQQSYNYYKDFWEYDPDANTWLQKADLGGPARVDAVGFSIGSKGYLGTGFFFAGANYFYKDFWEYDPDLNSWTQKADFGGTARGSAVGFSIGSKGYVGTGIDDTYTYKNDFWEYDPDLNSWMQKADFGGTARSSAIGFTIGSKGYIGTGYDGSYKKDFWEYTPDCDPSTNETLGDGLDNNCNGIQDENNSLRFDGTNDYITVPNESAFDFTNALTVEAWIRIDAFNKDWQAIVTKGNDSWRLHRYQNTNFISFATTGISGGGLQSTINVNDGEWHHVAGVYDGSHKYIYIDGNLDVSVAVTGTINNSSYNVAIGENLQQTGKYWKGKIDEVRIWNIARTQAEIQASMNATICSNTPGLVAYFPFNEGVSGGTNTSVVSADDVTPNNNNGTLSGFALTGMASNWVNGATSVFPLPEICYNNIDDNCNGQVDEGCVNTIATGTITGSPFCPEAIVSVPFSSVGIFNTGNFYTGELSDKQGLFTTPTAIGSLSSIANSGTITAQIPSSPKGGSKYRIRVTSSNPEVPGSDNGSNLKLIACNKPTGLNATMVTSSSAKINWTGVSCAVKYKVQYRKQGTGAWTTKNATTTSSTITGLMANTSYEYRVETYCSSSGSSNSGYTAIYGFTTTLKMGSDDVSAVPMMGIYPNPTEGQATIQFTLIQPSHISVKVYDMSGKEIETLLNDELQSGEHSLEINTSHFAKGVYLVRMISEMGMENQKLVVQ